MSDPPRAQNPFLPVASAEVEDGAPRAEIERTQAGFPICGAATSATGKPCRRTAGQGTDHFGYGSCSRHGGNLPTHKQHAAKQELQAAASYALGAPENVDPADALMGSIAATAGHVKFLADKVAQFEIPETAVHIQLDHFGRPTGVQTDDIGFMTPNQAEWYKLYLIERQRLVDYSALAIRVGLEARQVAMAEKLGNRIAALLDVVIGKLELTPAQHEIASRELPTLLRKFGDDLL